MQSIVALLCEPMDALFVPMWLWVAVNARL
jgi:hypothetical protein